MHALWVVIDNIFFRAIADIACLKVRGDYFHETFTERIEKIKNRLRVRNLVLRSVHTQYMQVSALLPSIREARYVLLSYVN